MGVVYRADDLRLGQPVALKFLPPALAQAPGRIEALYAETRNARQISHPNVCRVYDVGEHSGRHFLSMEYVDGEDLASLLKRIGRLPAAKALEIARQLCAGLAAAHDLGVVHRDLKPANVMLDGHGRARITDFGLACRPEDEGAGTAGTPLYMAPEQLAGGRASFRSDVYALGLVLYELHTGRRAFPANNLAELRAMHASRSPAPPSRHAPDVDPGVERAILSCLEPDPAARPASVLQLAAALPGGDPLAAMIAEGQTPSPEMVAAAGVEGRLRPAAAWALLASFLGLLATVLVLAPRVTLLGIARPPKAPEALAERAREIVARAGYGDEPGDAAYWLEPAAELLVAGAENAGPERPGALVRFSYRQSPRPLVSVNPLRRLSDTNPPMDVPGMVSVELESTGRLLRFRAVPPASVSDPGEAADAEPDWDSLLLAAGLDAPQLIPFPSTWVPPVAFDAQKTWQVEAGPDRRAVHVEAASWRGRPVLFAVTEGSAVVPTLQAPGRRRAVLSLLWLVCFVLALAQAVYFARRNVCLGRADTRGALNVAVFLMLTGLSASALGAHHAYGTAVDLFHWLRTNLASTAWAAIFLWLFYVALEPYARRHWPRLLISWSRVLGGRWRDPRVGGDVLAGAVGGAGMAAGVMAVHLLGPHLAGAQVAPLGTDMNPLLGARHYAGSVLGALRYGLIGTVFTMFFLAVGSAVFRRRWAAAMLAGVLLLVAFMNAADPWLPLPIVVGAAAVGIAVFGAVVLRVGFVGGITTAIVGALLVDMPLAAGPSAWYAGTSLFSIALVVAAAAFGFLKSLGGRPLLAADAGES